LIHPALHESLSHDHHGGGCCAAHSQPALSVSDNHHCPICDFLAANHLQVSAPAPSIERNAIVKHIVADLRLDGPMSWPVQHEPRAPPVVFM
jgi:hypothetical protein